MKKINILNYTFLLLGLLIWGSCDLDVIPPKDMSAQTFWKTPKHAWYGLNSCYAQLGGMDIWDEMTTDNAHSHKPWEGPYELIQQDGITAGNDQGYSFGTIRVCNDFILKVENCEMSDELKTRMKAEARFIRALAYLNLTSKFGKVSIVTDVLEYDAPLLERDPVDKVQEFILTELSEIAEILPDSYEGGELYEKSRITRAAALALEARSALYFGDFAKAEAASKKVISEGHHSLFRVTTLNAAQQKEADEMDQYIDFAAKGIDKDKFVKGMFSYEGIWHDQNANPSNPEYILTREYMGDDNNNDWTRYTYIRPSQLVSGYCSFEPMQDLVDAYWDIDGKTIRPEISKEERAERYLALNAEFDGLQQKGYIAKVENLDITQYEYMDEFRNRDSRLYASILFPLKGWHQTDFGDFYFRWDQYSKKNDGNESWTGYCYRKFVSLEPYNDWASTEDFPIIRYAEVLLTFAEARIQNSGYDAEVRSALNDLRDRCGMPEVPTSFSSKEAALNFVRNERRIELAGEGHRYEDIRRYGNDYCSSVMSGTTYAPDGTAVVTKSWSERLMLMPIPTGASDVNPLLKKDQNPGY